MCTARRHMGSGGTAPLILKNGTRRKRVVIYTTQPLNILNVFIIYCVQKLQFKSQTYYLSTAYKYHSLLQIKFLHVSVLGGSSGHSYLSTTLESKNVRANIHSLMKGRGPKHVVNSYVTNNHIQQTCYDGMIFN